MRIALWTQMAWRYVRAAYQAGDLWRMTSRPKIWTALVEHACGSNKGAGQRTCGGAGARMPAVQFAML